MKFLAFLITFFSFYAHAASYSQTIDQLGHKSGVVTQNSIDEKNFYFPLPKQSIVESAKLTFFIEFNSMMIAPSTLTIILGETAVYSTNLIKSDIVNESGILEKIITLDVPLTLFKEKFLPVKIKISSFINNDPCIDRRIVSGLVRIKENSNLKINYNTRLLDAPNFIQTMESKTTAYLHTKGLNLNQFKVLFDFIATTDKLNKKLTFVSNPLEASIHFFSDEKTLPFYSEQGMFVTKTNKSVVLGVNLNVKQDFSLFTEGLEALYPSTKNPILEKKDYDIFKTRDELSLTSLGINSERGSVWSSELKTKTGLEPKKLHLSLTSAPYNKDLPANFFIYYNQELIKVLKINKSSGSPQYYGIELPESSMYPGQIQMIASYGKKGKKCESSHNNLYDIHILPDTQIEYGPIKNENANFSKFAATSQKGVDIIIPEIALKNPLRYIPFLVNIQKVFSLPLLAINMTNESSTQNSIRFVSKEEISKNLYINSMESVKIAGKPQISFLQVLPAKAGYELQVGLLSNTVPGYFNLFSAGDEDIAIISKNHVEVLTHSTSLHSRIQSYSDKDSLSQFFDEWKYYLLITAWLILTLVFIRLAKKFK